MVANVNKMLSICQKLDCSIVKGDKWTHAPGVLLLYFVRESLPRRMGSPNFSLRGQAL